jgi:hypothetical protein
MEDWISRTGGKQVAFDSIRSGTATAVRHTRQKEQAGKALRATQRLVSLSLILPAVASLAGN